MFERKRPLSQPRHPAQLRFAEARSRPGLLQRMGFGTKRLMLLAAALAVPAIAAPLDWRGDARAAAAPVVPMGFEVAGESFPGSAFYYLEDTPYAPAPQAELAALDLDLDEDALAPLPDAKATLGELARPLVVAGGYEARRNALQCMTMAIYYEAASEPDAGQRAVAQVVLNRVAHRSYPGSVCGVVFQGSERKTGCQFSFTCDGSLARKPSARFWARAESVARSALAGAVYHPVGLATHYHTTQIYPYWAPSLAYLGTIGAHRFYRFGGKAGTSGAFRFAHAGLEPAPRPHRSQAGLAETAAETDPLAIAKAWEEAGRAQAAVGQAATPSASAAVAPARAAAPAPDYAPAVRERGGDAIYRADKAPAAGAVKPEYENAGQWIAQPGATPAR